jgi:ketosteroid isomerase-like protein
VTLIRVRDGKIAEALAYAKTPMVTDLGQASQSSSSQSTSEVIRRFNEAFQQHDPAALPELIAADCVIENSNPAPNGSRHVGREACLTLWRRIATMPGTRFDLEDVVVTGERATIRWRLRWGESESDSVRGVNLMHVRDGQIVEALGYVKGA